MVNYEWSQAYVGHWSVSSRSLVSFKMTSGHYGQWNQKFMAAILNFFFMAAILIFFVMAAILNFWRKKFMAAILIFFSWRPFWIFGEKIHGGYFDFFFHGGHFKMVKLTTGQFDQRSLRSMGRSRVHIM